MLLDGTKFYHFPPINTSGCEGMMCIQGGVRRPDRKGCGYEALPFSLAGFSLKQVTDGGTVSEQ